MKLDSATWSRIAELFDAVVDMAPGDRRRWLDEHAPSGEIREYLDRLLAAHETPDPLVVDEALDDVVGRMLDDRDGDLQRIPDDLAGRVFGNWRALEEIGRGGMSVVLRGERADERFEKSVAIKLLPPGPTTDARRERLQAEIRLLARLEHPGVARLIDGGVTEEGMPFLVMEHVDGMPITQFCERHRPGLAERVRLVIEAAEALAYSHGRLVVHCDIKPSNVLVDREGRVKLVDFGIAAMLAEESEDQAVRPILRCSPAYAAPEQLRGDSPAVAQDVFALGSVLYELISGCRVRDARRTTSVFFGNPSRDHIAPPSAAARSGSVPGIAPGRLAGDLDAICLKALATDPDARYPAVEPLIRDLQHWLDNRPVAAREGGPLYRAGKWIRRHHWTAAAASLAVVSLLGGSSLALWQAEKAERAAEIARTEAARAEKALAETERALQRAEGLRDFLVGLFRAAEPNRPRNELPDSEEVLALGARRALDAGSAPPAERLGMLLAIGEVYLARERREEAAPLLEEAVALARENRERRPADLARALRLQASAAIRAGRFDEAEEKLREAIAVTAHRPEAWDVYADARATRGWVAYQRGEHEQARRLLEPLREQMEQDREVSQRTRYRILNHLAAVQVATGQLEKAVELRSELTQVIRDMEGPESRTFATNLSNLAVLDLRLGRFDRAMERLEKSLKLCERIFEHPTAWRAAARGNRAHAFLYTGQPQRALREMKGAARDWAAVQDRELESYEFHHHTRGMLLSRMHRWAEAETHLARAAELFSQPEAAPTGHAILNDALLARARCRQDRTDEGRAIMARVDRQLGGELPDSTTRRAEIHESRATCLHYAEKPEAALAAIDRSLETVRFPGYVVQRADRLMLKAEILAELDRYDEAAESLARAEKLFAELDLSDHPTLARVRSANRRLVAGH